MAHPAWPVDLLRELLDRVIDETGANQAALAALISMDPSQISRWRSGKSRPSFASLERLGDAARAAYPQLTVTTRELLAGGGYQEALGEETADGTPAHPSDGLPRIDPADSWMKDPPDDLWLGLVWADLPLAERMIWHLPNTSPATRLRLMRALRVEQETEAAAERYRRSLDGRSDPQRGRGANGA